MSSTLKRFKCYLQLLLDKRTKPDQRFGLLYTANVEQIAAVVEIIHNIIFGTIESTTVLRQKVKKGEKVLKRLTSSKRASQSQSIIVRKHYRLIAHIIVLVKNSVISLLS